MSGARQGKKISAAKFLEKNRAIKIAQSYVDEVEMYNAIKYDYGIERNSIAKERLGGPTARKLCKRLDQGGSDEGSKAAKSGDN